MTVDMLLIVDCETSGLDPQGDHLIEIGAVLWSIEHRCLLSCWSSLVVAPTNEAYEINRIPPASLAMGADKASAIATLRRMSTRAQVAVAHRAEFDSAWLPNLGIPWACSKFDMTWPHSKIGDSLVNIALANGVGVSNAHRALTDCLILSRMFERVSEAGVDVRSMIDMALRPKATFAAQVSYHDREKARAAGFRWDPARKQWLRTLAIEDASTMPFPLKEVTP